MAKVHILYAVLNWGLGHATRSAPLIRDMLGRGFRVSLASDGAALDWLHGEFPQLPCYQLPGYRIHYSRYLPAQWAVIAQAPRLAAVAAAERRMTRRILKEDDFTAVLSDNRLGCFSPELPSVYLSHQIQLPAGKFSWAATFLHRLYWRRFWALAIPDTAGGDLAGNLSQCTRPSALPVFRLGPLSHLAWGQRKWEPVQNRVVAVLSGPEPQRSILEEQLRKQMEALPDYEWYLVRGTGSKARRSCEKGLQCYDRLGSSELRELLATAELVISRSGYSSIMDYAQLGLPALLVPTPGQGEQEYLADYHGARGHAYAVKQDELDLRRDLPRARSQGGWPGGQPGDRAALFRFLEGE